MGIAKVARGAVEGDRVDFLKLEREKLIKEIAGSWKDVKGSSIDYIKRLRSGWGRRQKRVGI